MAKEIVVVSGCRTAIGSMGGSLKDVPVVQLGSTVIKEAVNRAGIKPDDVDEKAAAARGFITPVAERRRRDKNGPHEQDNQQPRQRRGRKRDFYRFKHGQHSPSYVSIILPKHLNFASGFYSVTPPT